MDTANNAYKQIVDLFESMTPGARITAGLLLTVVVVRLYFLVQGGGGAPDELLLGGTEFSRSDLDAMEAAFAQEGLSNYERLGNKVRIPRGQRDVYVAALAKNKALPTNFQDVFAQSLIDISPWQDSKTRDNRLKFAKQRELSMIIGAMSGIEQATVQYDEQVSTGFPRMVHKTAVVAIQPRGSAPLTDELASNIVDFLVHAIAGLKAENITVTDLKGSRSIVGGGQLAGGMGKDPYPAHKLMYERDWTEKVRRLLAYVPGAAVSVNVELDPVLNQVERNRKIDPKPVTVETFGQKRTETNQGSSPGGRPGVATNTSTANQPATVAAGTTRSEQRDESSESSRMVFSEENTSTERASLTPTRVSVSVAIPTAYYLQMFAQKNPPVAGQEPKKPTPAELEALEKEVETRISSTITPQLPKRPAGVDPYPQVVVTRMPDLPVEVLAAPTLADTGMTWLGAHWSTLGMLIVGLFGVATLRNLLGSLPTPDPEGQAATREERPALRVVSPDSVPTDAAASSEAGGEPEVKPRRRRRSAAQGAPDLREELAEIVREDPDAAAKILRNWIGEAG